MPPIPEETRQTAQQIYPPEHLLRRLGQEYADVLRDEDFADLYPPTGQPALSTRGAHTGSSRAEPGYSAPLASTFPSLGAAVA